MKGQLLVGRGRSQLRGQLLAMKGQLVEKRLGFIDEGLVLGMVFALIRRGEQVEPVDELARVTARRGEFAQRVAAAVALARFRNRSAEVRAETRHLVDHGARALRLRVAHEAHHREREIEAAVFKRLVAAFTASQA